MHRRLVYLIALLVSFSLLFSVSVAMAASSGGMAGQVRGWTPSEKANGAIVTAYLKQLDGSYVFQAQSAPADTNGNYEIVSLPMGIYRVSYSHPMYGLMWYDESWTADGATDVEVTSSGLGAFALQFIKTSVPVVFDFGTGFVKYSPSPLPSVNDLLVEPEAPSNPGFEISGWYSDPTFTTAWNFSTDTVPAESLTLYAKWESVEYTASFNSDGGSSVDSQNINFGGLITKPADPTKEGYTFDGWFNGETEWDFANDTMPADGVTLMAQWTVNTYTASFDSNGGSSVDSQDVSFGSLVTKPANPTKEGYTFDGWFNGETEWDFANDTMPVDGVNLMAYWTVNTYTASFDSNGGSSVDSQDVSFGSLITNPADPTKEGYTFDGWFNGESEWDFAHDTMPADGVTLMAQWTVVEIPEFTVVFNSSGGSTTPSVQVSQGGGVALPTPTKLGYSFLGWFTSASGGTKVTALTAVNSNIVLYAHWASSDAYIKSTVISKGTISPKFTRKHYSYRIYFTGASNNIILKAIRSHAGSKMSVRVGSGTWKKATTISLYVKVGQTKKVTFRSVSEDGKTIRFYTYTVYHAWDK